MKIKPCRKYGMAIKYKDFPWKKLLLKIFENIKRVHYVGQFHDTKDVTPEIRSNTSKFGLAKNHQNI